jgi:hypothetical protein
MEVNKQIAKTRSEAALAPIAGIPVGETLNG